MTLLLYCFLNYKYLIIVAFVVVRSVTLRMLGICTYNNTTTTYALTYKHMNECRA